MHFDPSINLSNIVAFLIVAIGVVRYMTKNEEAIKGIVEQLNKLDARQTKSEEAIVSIGKVLAELLGRFDERGRQADES